MQPEVDPGNGFSHMRDAILGNARVPVAADPERDLAARDSSLASKEFVSSDSALTDGAVPKSFLVWQRLALPAIRMVTLIWALILGQSITAESLAAREVAPASDGPVGTAKVVGQSSSSPVPRLAKVRTCRRTSVAPHFPRPRFYDPNDDSASDDYTDDDDWEALSADDNSDEVVFAWFPEIVCFLTFHEVDRAPAWPEIPSSPFLPPQRLRC
jgi:hypothetical protein